MQHQIGQGCSDDAQTLRRPVIVPAAPAQQPRAQDIKPRETDFRQIAFDLALDPQVERLGHGVRPYRADMDEAFDPQRVRSACGIEYQLLVDRTKRGLVAADLLPCGAERADHRLGADRLDHLAPFGGIRHEQFHANAARQGRFAARDAGQPQVFAPDALRDHRRTDQTGGPDQCDPQRVRHCSTPRASRRKCARIG